MKHNKDDKLSYATKASLESSFQKSSKNISYGPSSVWYDFTTKHNQDLTFESQTITEQARRMSMSILTKDEDPLFDFDYIDNDK